MSGVLFFILLLFSSVLVTALFDAGKDGERPKPATLCKNISFNSWGTGAGATCDEAKKAAVKELYMFCTLMLEQIDCKPVDSCEMLTVAIGNITDLGCMEVDEQHIFTVTGDCLKICKPKPKEK